MTALVLSWAARLGSFLFMRVLAAGKDSRFDEIKDKPRAPNPPSVFHLQGTGDFANVLVLVAHPCPPPHSSIPIN